MAETKSGSSSRRSNRSPKPRSRSRGASRSRGSPARAKSSPSTKAKSSPSKSNGANRVEAIRRSAGGTAKDAGQAVGRAASKAKLPLVAGGAALAGAAGGMALGARQGRRWSKLKTASARRPMVKLRSQDLASAAKDVGAFGSQVGHLASELQHAREEASGNRHRSPIEVVLDGLTARRSRS